MERAEFGDLPELLPTVQRQMLYTLTCRLSAGYLRTVLSRGAALSDGG